MVAALETLFEQHVSPLATAFVTRLLPYPMAAKLFIGDYGMLTLGVRYAFAIVLPLVTAFFLMFAVLEDSGYLPRLAMLVDRSSSALASPAAPSFPGTGVGMRHHGDAGDPRAGDPPRAADRHLPAGAGYPCSAQLGVILGMLSSHPVGLAIWAGVVVAVFLVSGFLAARLLPGAKARFYLEIPPFASPHPAMSW